MAKRRKKEKRKKGKISLSEYWKELKQGDVVAIVPEHGVNIGKVHEMFKGKCGRVLQKIGKKNFYVVEVTDGRKVKKLIIHGIHLKKLQTSGS